MAETEAVACQAVAVKPRTAVVYVPPPVIPSPFNPENPNFKPRVPHPESKLNIKYPTNPPPQGGHRFSTAHKWTRQVNGTAAPPTQDSHTHDPPHTPSHRSSRAAAQDEDHSGNYGHTEHDFEADGAENSQRSFARCAGGRGEAAGGAARSTIARKDPVPALIAAHISSSHTVSDSDRQSLEHPSPLDDAEHAPVEHAPTMQPPLSHHSRTNSATSLSAGSDMRSSSSLGSSDPSDQRDFSSNSSGQIDASGDPNGRSSYGGEEAGEQLSPAQPQATPFKMGYKWGKEILRANSHREAKIIARRVAVFEGSDHEEAMDGFKAALKTDASAPDDEAAAAQQAQYMTIASGQLPESASYDRMTAVPHARGARRTSLSQRSIHTDSHDEEGEIGAVAPTGWGTDEADIASARRSVEYDGGSGSYHRNGSGSDRHGYAHQLSKQQRKQLRQQHRQAQKHLSIRQPVRSFDPFERAPWSGNVWLGAPPQQQIDEVPGKWGRDSFMQPQVRQSDRHPQQYVVQTRDRHNSRVVTAAASPQLYEIDLAGRSDMSDRQPHRNYRKGQKQYASSDYHQLAARDSRFKEHSRAARSSEGHRPPQRTTSPPHHTAQHQGRGDQPRQLAPVPAPVTTDQKLGMSLDAIGKKRPQDADQPPGNTAAATQQSKKRPQDAAFVSRRHPDANGGGSNGAPGQGSKTKRTRTTEYDGSKQHGGNSSFRGAAPLQGRQHGMGNGHRAAAGDSKTGSRRSRGGVKHRESKGGGQNNSGEHHSGKHGGSNRGNNGGSNSGKGSGGGGGIARSAVPAGISRVPAALYGALSGSKGGNAGSNLCGGSTCAAGPKLQASGKHKAIEFSLGQNK